MVEETRGETTERYYTVTNADGSVKKFYCPFQDREELDVALRGRRSSFQRAIEIFMAEVCESRLLKVIKTGLQHQ